MADQNPRFSHPGMWQNMTRDIIQVLREARVSSLRDTMRSPSAFSRDCLPRKLPAQPKTGLKRFHPEEAQEEAEDKEEEQDNSSEAAESDSLACWSPGLGRGLMPPTKSIKLLPGQGPFAQEESHQQILGGEGMEWDWETFISSHQERPQNGYEGGKEADRGTKTGEGVVSGIQTHGIFSLGEVTVCRSRAVQKESLPLSQYEEEEGDQAGFWCRPSWRQSRVPAFWRSPPWGQRAGAVLDLSQRNPQRASGALDLTQHRLGGQVALGSLQLKSEGQIGERAMDISRPRPQDPIAVEAPAFPEYRAQDQLLGGPLDLSRPRSQDPTAGEAPAFPEHKPQGQLLGGPLDLSKPRSQDPIAGEAPAFPEYRPQGQLLGGPLDLSRPRPQDQINGGTPDLQQAAWNLCVSFVGYHIQRWCYVLLPLLLMLQLLHHHRRI
ncbi:uncharacterized protein LOC128409273 [Podarcis raffonei]|uniref:uncharacterized protein LOC128409273 n=1 Tax=Podarcis raffonei TaxID=65483 RepID=UPI0023292B50|nr:uncharacterized protein LOC128409273 [Podarcis raffonei]